MSESSSTIPDLVAAGEIAHFKEKVRAAYGFEVTDAYAEQMIAFVDGCLAEVAEMRRYLEAQTQKRAIEMAREGYVRVLDPDNGRFLFEFNPETDVVLWRDRKQVKVIDLKQYKQGETKP